MSLKNRRTAQAALTRLVLADIARIFVPITERKPIDVGPPPKMLPIIKIPVVPDRPKPKVKAIPPTIDIEKTKMPLPIFKRQPGLPTSDNDETVPDDLQPA